MLNWEWVFLSGREDFGLEPAEDVGADEGAEEVEEEIAGVIARAVRIPRLVPLVASADDGAGDEGDEMEGAPGELFLTEEEGCGEEASSAEEVTEVEDFIVVGKRGNRGALEGAGRKEPESAIPDGIKNCPRPRRPEESGKLHRSRYEV